MPLPPALAARLAKRGIIPKEKAEDQNRRGEEEVFAESYDGDDDSRPSYHARGAARAGRSSETEDKTKFMGYPGCPNKWNVYHDCGLWCQNTWGGGKPSPDRDYLNRYKRMMDKYGPLPDGWKEKYDPGTGRHYFWCSRTDRVSWLPPGHPKAKITESASRVREMLASHAAEADEEEEDDDDDDDRDDDEEDDEEDQAMELDSDMDSDEDRDDARERRERERRRGDRRRGERPSRRGRGGGGGDKPDPMDPASYSDAPRGTWSSGLEGARTGK